MLPLRISAYEYKDREDKDGEKNMPREIEFTYSQLEKEKEIEFITSHCQINQQSQLSQEQEMRDQLSQNQQEQEQLTFSIRSRDDLPGFARGDVVSSSSLLIARLSLSFAFWRRKLDDTYVDVTNPICLDFFSYASVFHYYQSRKFDHVPEFAVKFAIQSGHSISKNVRVALSATYENRPKQVQPIVRSRSLRNEIRYKALVAKFTQSDLLRTILCATGDARLLHVEPDHKTTVDVLLMTVRSQMSKKEI